MSKYLLGEGVVARGGVPIGLTRGGSRFTVEREYKEIVADGDMGPVKGRIRKDKSVARLLVNQLEHIPADIIKMYPALSSSVVGDVTTITAKEDIEAVDYQATVTFTGKLDDGTAVVITLEDAINLDNVDLGLLDKDEVVAALTYTATYDPTTRKTEPWKIEYTAQA